MTKFFALFALSLVLVPGCANDAGRPDSTDTQPVIACGSSELRLNTHDGCAPMDAAAVPDPDNGSCLCMLGYAWNGSQCTMLADCACQGTDCDKLMTDRDACEAAHASCTEQVASPPRLTCGDSKRFSSTYEGCAPMDAKAVDGEDGACPCMLGFAWNGTACSMLSNCACEGADCDKLMNDKDACEAAHASCH